MDNKRVYVYIDGSSNSDSLCDYGVNVAKTLNLELKLLNTVEHSHTSKKINLSGNIGLGAREDILEELSKEEADESKMLISKGKEALNHARERVISNGYLNIITSQRHGSLYENLIELEGNIRVLIIGLRGKDSEGNNLGIGKQVEEIIRSLHVPTLLINTAFTPIKSVLIAYDGSEASEKALDMIAKTPIFGNIKRYIVSVNKSEGLLQNAKKRLEDSNIEATAVMLKGDPLEEILSYQEKNNIDIIAMGAFSHSRIRDALFGSFTHAMLLKVKKPLLLLR